MTGVHRKLSRISPAVIYSASKYRPIVVELEPPGTLIGFRLKGTRRVYHLPVAWCFTEALKAHVERERAEKRAARKAARG